MIIICYPHLVTTLFSVFGVVCLVFGVGYGVGNKIFLLKGDKPMKRQCLGYLLLLPLVFMLSGCGVVGDKTANLSAVYGVTAILALAVLAGYCFLSRKKDIWYLLLFSSVLVVNLGYLWISVSDTRSIALIANRVAYLGSVFLPFSMFMITLNTIKVKCKRWVTILLLCVCGIVFLIAASPGYLNIYYKEVYHVTVNGFSTLKKVYGPLHSLYLIYLVGYFVAMIYAIVYAYKKMSAESMGYTVILTMAVFVNLGLWFIEQLVSIDFEILSVSYIISELFLLGLNILMSEHNKLKEQQSVPCTPQADVTKVEISKERQKIFIMGVAELTKTEKIIYDAYVEGKSTKEIMGLLGITENTLKFHNKNIYSKLGVSSRKQLVEISKAL